MDENLPNHVGKPVSHKYVRVSIPIFIRGESSQYIIITVRELYCDIRHNNNSFYV